MKNFGRILTAMVTPFNDDLSVNYQAAANLAKHLWRMARTAWSSPAAPARRPP